MSVSQAATLDLATTMDGDSFISESTLTGAIAQINFGDGSLGDDDGLYDINDPSTLLEGSGGGGGVDIFPGETAFAVGGLTYLDEDVVGIGTEVVGVDSLDLSAWSNDIPVAGRNDWFFDAPNFFSFGAVGPEDTVTLQDGVVTGADLSVTATFSIFDFSANQRNFTGTFSISGADLSFQINDVQDFSTLGGTFPTNVIFDLTGSVNAIPEPSTSLLFGASAGLLFFRRRR